MCTNYMQIMAEKALAKALAAQVRESVAEPPAGSIFPKRKAYVARTANGRRVIDTMRWGFPPPPNAKAPVVNVRNLDSPFWRSTVTRTPSGVDPIQAKLVDHSNVSYQVVILFDKGELWQRPSRLTTH